MVPCQPLHDRDLFLEGWKWKDSLDHERGHLTFVIEGRQVVLKSLSPRAGLRAPRRIASLAVAP